VALLCRLYGERVLQEASLEVFDRGKPGDRPGGGGSAVDGDVVDRWNAEAEPGAGRAVGTVGEHLRPIVPVSKSRGSDVEVLRHLPDRFSMVVPGRAVMPFAVEPEQRGDGSRCPGFGYRTDTAGMRSGAKGERCHYTTNQDLLYVKRRKIKIQLDIGQMFARCSVDLAARPALSLWGVLASGRDGIPTLSSEMISKVRSRLTFPGEFLMPMDWRQVSTDVKGGAPPLRSEAKE